MKKGKKSSSGDNSFEHPYMVPEKYMVTIDERLKRNNTFYSPGYRAYLEKQEADCLAEIQKKRKIDLLPK